MRLEKQVALITGGTSGIGEATAHLFAREGAKVAITGRNESRGHAVTARILEAGGEAIFLRTDVRRAPECQRAVDETIASFGRLDILFNNAGVFFPQTALECTEDEWDLQIDINLKGTFLMSKCALAPMIAQGRGVIINNSSGWGLVGGDRAVAYCASKGGVVLLTKAMAIDHGRQGIRVNCICPGDVDTPSCRKMHECAVWIGRLICRVAKIGRWEELARLTKSRRRFSFWRQMIHRS
jgi:NAD(P)-dependent dehydrogenase (short-subunit alcohol dehydrogenase family)